MSSKAVESTAAAAVVVVIAHKTKRNRKRLTANFLHKRNKRLNILGEVRMDSCALCRNFTRMTASDFEIAAIDWTTYKRARH